MACNRKYGSPHRQIRALVILDGLIHNAGSRFQRTFADEPLLERLRMMPRDETVDPQVRQKCQVLFRQWASAYKTTQGLERIANLYKELPKTAKPQAARQKVLQAPVEPENVFEEPPVSRTTTVSSVASSNPVTLTPTTSSSFSSKLSKHKSKAQGKPFNLAREKENMTNAIAQASMASTNLLNGLQLVNREKERVSENAEVLRRFEACKLLRRRVLYYIQNVESDQWIGSLVNANDELVRALTAYEIMDKSIDDDSDSDAWEHSQHPAPKSTAGPSLASQQQLAGLSLEEKPPAKPPRPTSVTMPQPPVFHQAAGGAQVGMDEDDEEDEDDDDPFGDSNAAPTPHQERSGMTWKDV